MYDLSITPFQSNSVSYHTLLQCYTALFEWHPTRSLEQKLQRFKPCQRPYCDTYCFAYVKCPYPCQMSHLVCHVITHMPVSSPFYPFSCGGSQFCKHNGTYTHNFMAAIFNLVFQNNEMAAMLVYKTNPVRVQLFSYVNTLFCHVGVQN